MSKERRWTPGPWSVDISGIRGGFRVYAKEMQRHEAKAADNDGVDGATVSHANRALIRAAPDLYDALERCEARMAGHPMWDSEDAGPSQTLQMVRAALAKARGEPLPSPPPSSGSPEA